MYDKVQFLVYILRGRRVVDCGDWVVPTRNLAYVNRIFLVDDSLVIRKTLRRMFEEAGWFICGEAANGQETVTNAKECKPDIIILDLAMPVMNGLTAGNLLKTIVPATILILFTSFGSIVNSEDLRRSGISVLIDKNEPGKLLPVAQGLLSSA